MLSSDNARQSMPTDPEAIPTEQAATLKWREVEALEGDLAIKRWEALALIGILNKYRRGRISLKDITAESSIAVPAEGKQRFLRYQAAFAFACEMFSGDREKARRWFSTPSPILNGTTPLVAAETKESFIQLEKLIRQLRGAAQAAAAASPAIPKESTVRSAPPVALPTQTAPTQADFPPRDRMGQRLYPIKTWLAAELAKNGSSKTSIAKRAIAKGAATLTASRLSYLSHGYNADGHELLALAAAFGIRPEALVDQDALTRLQKSIS